jgi:benzoyl-CoA reductase/2-hydroxyglutaryl-CoA dehydratase subunit BcrC/BadD/HgdB
MAYDVTEKALATEIVRRSGGEITAEVMEDIRAALNRPALTAQSVRNWLKQKPSQTNFADKKTNLSPADVQQHVEETLDNTFERIARQYLAHASEDEVIDATKGKDAVIAAATAVDKMRLLRGLPTEIVQMMPDVLAAIEKLGQKPHDVFQRIIQQAIQDTDG